MPTGERSIVQATPASLRALAHPIRLKILGRLRTHGPATATSLAALMGLNSGATSYHLRQLAQHGFIVEETAHGTGRERWWRAAHTTTRVDRESWDDEAAGEPFLRAIAQLYSEKMHQTLDERLTMPRAWQDSVDFGDRILRLTAEETQQLGRDLGEVLSRYRHNDPHNCTDAPADAIPVNVQFQVLPSAVDFGDPSTDDADDSP